MTPGGPVADRSPCAATARHGGACRSWAPPGSVYCVAHDPARAAEQRAARRKGGAAAGRLRVLRGKRARLDSAQALRRFLGDVVQDVLAGTTTPEIGRVVVYGVATLRQVIESGDLEKRLEALEARAAAGPRSTTSGALRSAPR